MNPQEQLAEIAELVAALKSLKEQFEVLYKDAKSATNNSFKLLPDEKAALQTAEKLIKKYELEETHT